MDGDGRRCAAVASDYGADGRVRACSRRARRVGNNNNNNTGILLLFGRLFISRHALRRSEQSCWRAVMCGEVWTTVRAVETAAGGLRLLRGAGCDDRRT